MLVRVGLCSVCLRLGGEHGGQRSSCVPVVWDKMKSVGDVVHRGTRYATTYSHRHIYTSTHRLRRKHRHTYAGRLLQPCLPCNLQHQRRPSPFQMEHMVQTLKTKQTDWPPRCTVHGVRLVFLSPLTRSIYTDSKSTPHLWLGLHTYIPIIIQTCIANRFLSLTSLPRVLFQWTLLCFKSGSTSKQRNGQIDSWRQMLFHKILSFGSDHSDAFLVAVRSHSGTK